MKSPIHLNGEVSPRLLSYEQAASFLGVSESTVKRLVAKGMIPIRKILGTSLIAVVDLLEFMEQCKRSRG